MRRVDDERSQTDRDDESHSNISDSPSRSVRDRHAASRRAVESFHVGCCVVGPIHPPGSEHRERWYS